MIALLVAIALSATAPDWQRQDGETCQNYAARLEADGHALWRAHWCGDGPCSLAVPAVTPPARTAASLSVHPYWLERRHGCDL